MATTARGHNYRLAWGHQSAQGTAQATALYEMALEDGGIEPVKTEEQFGLTAAADTAPGYFITSASSMGDPTFIADNEATDHLFAAHLGADAITGPSSGTYTHVGTKADAKWYLTFYQKRPDIVGGTDKWERAIDMFPRTVEVSGTAGNPLKVKTDLIGTAHRFNVSAPTITNDRRVGATSAQILSMIGSTLKLDLAATPSTTTVTNIESFVLTSSYANAAWIQTNALAPSFFQLGPYSLGISCTVVFDSFASYAGTFFGTSTVGSDMDQSAVVVTGSADFSCSILPTVSATRFLEVASPSLRWEVSLPKAQPSGEAVRATLTAKLQTPASGEPITVTSKSTAAADWDT